VQQVQEGSAEMLRVVQEKGTGRGGGSNNSDSDESHACGAGGVKECVLDTGWGQQGMG